MVRVLLKLIGYIEMCPARVGEARDRRCIRMYGMMGKCDLRASALDLVSISTERSLGGGASACAVAAKFCGLRGAFFSLGVGTRRNGRRV